jgi:predicted RNA binding protein YcfA (HicA-like mRNA interferase family)
MDKLPQISGKEAGRVLARLGFHLQSQKGSHMKFVRERQDAKEIIVVPNHTVLRKGTLHSILKKLDFTVMQFKKLL